MSVDERATISVCSPPPCGEGLGVGVVRFWAGGATEISPHHPPPQPSPTRGEGADRARGSSIESRCVTRGLDPRVHRSSQEFLAKRMDCRVISAFTRVFDAL